MTEVSEVTQDSGGAVVVKVATIRGLLQAIVDGDAELAGYRLDDKLLAKKLLVSFSADRDTEALSAKDVALLRKAYADRWTGQEDSEGIAYSESSYTRCQAGQNAHFIEIARQLAAGRLIDNNYYQFLMPTVVSTNASNLMANLVDVPLNQLVLADNGRRLIKSPVKVGDIRRLLDAIIENDISLPGNRFEDNLLAKRLMESLPLERADEPLRGEDVQLLREAYRTRWGGNEPADGIIYSSSCYTRHQQGQNAHFIEIARLLAEAGFIDENYYRFLMPTVETSHDGTLRVPIHKVSLNELIVTDDGKQFINIAEAVRNFVGNKMLVYFLYNDGKEKNLTKTEMVRFEATNPELWQLYREQSFSLKEDKYRITEQTIIELTRLVEDSVFERGTYDNYTAEENSRAQTAYKRFWIYINHQITPEERHALFSQHIEMNWNIVTFEEQYTSIVTDKVCLTLAAQPFCKLIIDYQPDKRFENPVVNTWIEAEGWREKSKNKQFDKRIPIKGYAHDEAFYRARCVSLFVYILTNRFKCYGGSIIAFDGVEKTVTSTASNIHRKILTGLHSKNFTQAYFEIMEHVVKPVLNKPKPYSRYSETQQWLVSLKDGSFWQQRQALAEVDNLAERFLYFLRGSSALSVGDKTICLYRDKVLSLLAKKTSLNTSVVDIKVAVCVEDFLCLISKDSRFEVEEQLMDESLDTYFDENPEFVHNEMVNELLRHLASLRPTSIRLFGAAVTVSSASYARLHEKLETLRVDYCADPKEVTLNCYITLLKDGMPSYVKSEGINEAKAFLKSLGYSEQDIANRYIRAQSANALESASSLITQAVEDEVPLFSMTEMVRA